MLKKDLCVPGSFVEVLAVIKDGLPAIYGGSGTLSHIDLMSDAGNILEGSVAVLSGSVLKILIGPKKYGRINCIKVETSNGVSGYVYWCGLRVSAKHV